VASSAASQIVTFEEFEANFRSRELRRHGAKVKLPDQSFQVLVMLLERPGELVTREELHTQLWPADTFIDFDHGLNNAVNRLREALGDAADNPRFAETLPRRGYRFIGTTNGAAIYTPGVSDAKNVPAGVLIQKDKGTKRWMA
jgi:DNA-binding winged helix-turn-helix (wHTH) protein